jgi:putative spermidine/putrescine transport system substrate-binding protein
VNCKERDRTLDYQKEKSVKISKLGKVAVVAAVSIALAVPTLTSASAASKWSTASSVAAGGGAGALRSACKAEGALNIIATPGDWANYQEIFDGFTAKYGVKINSDNPNGNSQYEVDTANSLKGTMRSPDVFDLSAAIGTKYIDIFAPYKVANWANIPNVGVKDSQGRLTPNYTGLMMVGYDSSLGTVTKLDDLKGAAFKGKVALNGDPTKANAGLNGVLMASLANGGSFSDISKGVTWFKQLKDVGNFINVDPTPASIASGQTPVVFDWSYNQKSVIDKFAAVGKTWKTFVPKNASVGAFYEAGISAWAPHPACARAWMEYLYSTAGQNAWAKGGASPVLWAKLLSTHLASAEAISVIGSTRTVPNSATLEQATTALTYLKANWAAAVGTR